MIVIQVLGGLGNQLFQYAAARRLALGKQTELKVDISAFDWYSLRHYKLDQFTLQVELASTRERDHFIGNGVYGKFYRQIEPRLRGRPHRHIFVEHMLYQFDADILRTPRSVYLQGYFQNEDYFRSIAPLIRREFTVKTPLSGENLAAANHIRATSAVSLHIRRGDYASDPATLAYHGLLPLDYYHRAVARVVNQVEQPHFFVFSDDPAWARDHLQIDYPLTFVNHNDAEHDYEDLRLMQLCQHHIIANSSFSWWGAWLCDNPNKLVLAPKQWNKTQQFDTTYVTPPEWIRL